MKKTHILTLFALASLLNTTAKAHVNLLQNYRIGDSEAVSDMIKTLDQAVHYYCVDDIDGLKNTIDELSIEVITTPKDPFAKEIVDRWKCVNQALVENDYQTVREKLIDHTLLILSIGIGFLDYELVAFKLNQLEQLGTFTDKQKKTLVNTVNTIQQLKEYPTNRTKYILGALSGTFIVTGILISKYKDPKDLNSGLLVVCSYFLAIPFGIASYISHWVEKSWQADYAPKARIKKLVDEKLPNIIPDQT